VRREKKLKREGANMKTWRYVAAAVVVMAFVLGEVGAFAQTPVSQWGFIGNKGRTRTAGWRFVPGTVPGEAGVAGDGPLAANQWSAIRGGFDEPVTATMEQAVRVTGKIEFVGGDPKWWSALRWGLFYHDSAGVLVNVDTDSAYWTGYEKYANGYLFIPHNGVVDRPNWANGGGGDIGVVRYSTWLSTYGNNLSLGFVDQKPRRAEMTAGVYNWAVSVRVLPDGKKELRFYFVKEDNSYWFAATRIDTTSIAPVFNGVCFAINGGQGGSESSVRGMYVREVYVDRGAPIEIPEAPFVPFYVGQWGFIGNKGRTRTAGWKFVPGEFVGDAGVAGDGPLAANQWSAIRGGFDEPVTATTEQAVRVTGKIEFVGGDPKWWSALRWGLFYHDSAGVLVNVDTDSAYWTGYEKYANGYLFIPHNGVVDRPNWANGGGGDIGVVRYSTWLSTYGNNLSLGFVDQKPRRAEMTAGVYNWAVSVRVLPDGKKELRFYFVKEDNSYWFAATRIDTTSIAPVFNGVCFAINGGQGGSESSVRGMYVREVYVDRGAPIEIPEAPFVPFYVGQWGFIGNKGRTRTAGWKFVPGEFVGDAGVAGDQAPVAGQWAAIRGGFEDEVTVTTDQAIRVTGKIEFVGADPKWWGALRWGLFYHDSAGVLVNVDTDSAYWTGYESRAYGYLFHPHSGVLESPNWAAGGGGDLGVARGGTWLSTYGVNHLSMGFVSQRPRRAEMTAGVYNWGISVRPLPDGKRNEVRFYLVKEDNSYWWAGVVIDTTQITKRFNGVCFATIGPSGDQFAGYRGMYVREVYVDRGAPIEIPEAPFVPFYVGEWGFIGGRTGGWKLTPGEFEGNVTIGGTAKPVGWAAIRGGFLDPVKPSADKAIVVTGQMELVGGGFEGESSLRLGIFYSDRAGQVLNAETDSARWSGTEDHHSGYLLVPRSDWNASPMWGNNQVGMAGAVKDWVWLDPQGPANRALSQRGQYPSGAVAGPGIYDFKISIARAQGAGYEVRYWISKPGYHFAGIIVDDTPPTESFNSINFALSSLAGATTLNLIDVHVDRGAPIEIPDSILTAVSFNVAENFVPASYVLGQNYPNPFNPTTSITFGLPKDSEVTLEVFDSMGRVVATLAKGRYQAGLHTVTFDAKDLPSGVYLYRLKAGDFVSVKKLVLTK